MRRKSSAAWLASFFRTLNPLLSAVAYVGGAAGVAVAVAQQDAAGLLAAAGLFVAGGELFLSTPAEAGEDAEDAG